MSYEVGDIVWIDQRPYKIAKQVLFNQPAYRVIPNDRNARSSFVVDGLFCKSTKRQSAIYRTMLSQLYRDQRDDGTEKVKKRIEEIQKRICHIDKYVWEEIEHEGMNCEREIENSERLEALEKIKDTDATVPTYPLLNLRDESN